MWFLIALGVLLFPIFTLGCLLVKCNYIILGTLTIIYSFLKNNK